MVAVAKVRREFVYVAIVARAALLSSLPPVLYSSSDNGLSPPTMVGLARVSAEIERPWAAPLSLYYLVHYSVEQFPRHFIHVGGDGLVNGSIKCLAEDRVSVI